MTITVTLSGPPWSIASVMSRLATSFGSLGDLRVASMRSNASEEFCLVRVGHGQQLPGRCQHHGLPALAGEKAAYRPRSQRRGRRFANSHDMAEQPEHRSPDE
jgi:hypothetical protein